ncbi:MAG: hypothetical protein ACRDD7_11290 [Peptostreptococcaceae bacterium]
MKLEKILKDIETMLAENEVESEKIKTDLFAGVAKMDDVRSHMKKLSIEYCILNRMLQSYKDKKWELDRYC